MVVKAQFTAQDQATDPISPFGKGAPMVDEVEGYLNLSIRGTGFGAIVLQRKFPDDTDWFDVEEFVAATETALEDHEYGVEYRLLCTTYSAPVSVRLGSKRD